MYTIGDFLIQVKNAYRANKKQLTYQHSNVVVSLAKILEKEGFVSKTSVVENEGRKKIVIDLKYNGRIPALGDINLLSRPSVHHYTRKNNIKKAISRHGVGILSTNQGMMTSAEAAKKGIGGELICQVF